MTKMQSVMSVRTVLITLVVILAVALAWLPSADSLGQASVDEALRRALLAFALARGLNAVISVAQGTEIAVQPAGVGVNFTPGEVLDPVNDLIERFSWIMLLASSSLGIQKVLLSMSAWYGLAIAVSVLGVCVLVIRYRAVWAVYRPVLQRLFLFVLLLRFMMPAVTIANEWVYRTFLEADYIAASESLDQARETLGDINDDFISQAPQPSEGLC